MTKYVLYYNPGNGVDAKTKEDLDKTVANLKSEFLEKDDKIATFLIHDGDTRLELVPY